MSEQGRTLSEADVQAIAKALEDRLASRLITNAGKGILALAWKGVLLAVLWLAVYGMTSHFVRQ